MDNLVSSVPNNEEFQILLPLFDNQNNKSIKFVCFLDSALDIDFVAFRLFHQ